MPPVTRVRSAPRLEVSLRRAAPSPDAASRTRTIRHAARSIGIAVGAVWSFSLLGLLLWLGRVPMLEAGLWSIVSGAVAARGLQALSHRWMARWFEPVELELGPPDTPRLRRLVPGIAARYGYQLAHHAMGLDTFQPRWFVHLVAPLRVTWAGPGARVAGPRLVVRAVAAASVV